MALQRISAEAPLENILTALGEDGGVIVEGIFSEQTIAQLNEDISEFSRNFAPGGATQGLDELGKEFVGANTIRFSSIGKISEAYFDLLDNEVYAKIADAMLLPHCGSYWVNTAQAMYIGPGEDEQMLHRDCENWPYVAIQNWPGGAELTVSAMIALEEITEELGATRVIPGSHKWEDVEDHGDQSMTVPAEQRPGDAFIYTGKTVHGGGANKTTDRWRKALHLSFVVGWLTPEESNPLDYSTEELQCRSGRVQRLLGHRSYDPRPHFGGGLWLRHASKIEDKHPV